MSSSQKLTMISKTDLEASAKRRIVDEHGRRRIVQVLHDRLGGLARRRYEQVAQLVLLDVRLQPRDRLDDRVLEHVLRWLAAAVRHARNVSRDGLSFESSESADQELPRESEVACESRVE